MSKEKSEKEVKEKAAIEKLIELYPHKMTYTKNNPPKPDFELHMNNQVIGVEISEYINGKKYNEYKIKKKICNVVQKKLERFSSLNINIIWNLSDDIIIFNKYGSIEEISSSIVEEIVKSIPHPESEFTYEPVSFNPEINYLYKNETLEQIIDIISIRNYPSFVNKCFVGMSESHYSNFNLDIVNSIIKKKEEKLIEYSKSYTENWLIIPAFGEWLHSDIDSDNIEQFKFESKFEKTILIDWQKNKLIEL